MFKIVPEWAYNYEEFWDAVKRRNQWFIKLRYLTVFLLSFFLLFMSNVFEKSLTDFQNQFILIVIISILFYNLLLHFLSDKVKSQPRKFNCLHYSLLQMVLDLLSLLFLVYATGGIDSPFYLFFVFHMIIGSLILPGRVVFLLAFGSILLFSLLAILQYNGILDHHYIELLRSDIRNDSSIYVGYRLVIFSFMIFTSVFLANHIAHNLYKREKELKHALDTIEENEIAKQKYIMGLVHEIKTPLTAVRTILDLIIDNFVGPVSERVNEKLIQSRKRTNETISIINNVLRISKLKLLDEVSQEKIHIKSIFQNVIEILGPEANKKDITISLEDFNEKYFSDLTGDKILLELAISNLINNAVKYGNINGKVLVEIARNKDFIKIEVSDNGVGIPQNEIQNIFNQFYRASNIKRINKEGAGMGLSVVHEIIKRHGGNITVESPSKIGDANSPGTVFTITLPINF